MLEAEGILKKYRNREILKGVRLVLAPGMCLGIVGSNGCGKTTLLSILSGARRADGGQIRFDGRDAGRDRTLFRRFVAYVPQEDPLIGELTVRDNLLLWYRGDRTAMKRDLEQGPAAMLGVDGMLNMQVLRLSGGMKKRLSIACALADHAPYLILDEPGAALDMECKAAIRRYLQDYMQTGGAVLLTSHEMEELSVCTNLAVLRDGVLHPTARNMREEELVRQFR